MVRILLLLAISILCAESKAQQSIQLTSKKISFKNKNIWLFESMNIDYRDHSLTKLRLTEKTKSNLVISNWDADTLVFKLQGMVPYMFINLRQLDSSSLRISDLIFTKYTAVDTLISSSSKYKKDSLANNKSNIVTPNNSLKFEDPEIKVNVNGVPYKVTVAKSRIDNQVWYCTPGKATYSYDTKGVQIFYVVKMSPTN